jgi:hypothetical protein
LPRSFGPDLGSHGFEVGGSHGEGSGGFGSPTVSVKGLAKRVGRVREEPAGVDGLGCDSAPFEEGAGASGFASSEGDDAAAALLDDRGERIWASWPVQAVEQSCCVGIASGGGQGGHRLREERDQLGAGDWRVGDQVQPGPELVGC